MKTHYVTIKEYLAYMSGVCQDPILDFPVDILPEGGVESQPVDEEQEEKWGRSRRRCGSTKMWTWEREPTMKLVNGQQFLKSLLYWAQVMNLTTEQCQISEGSGIGSEFL